MATYGVIAQSLGNPRAARAVGNALNKNPFLYVPCHRVIRSDGLVGGFARSQKEKIKLLKEEGVLIVKERVNYKHILRRLLEL